MLQDIHYAFFFLNAFFFELIRAFLRCLEWDEFNIENKERNQK